MKFATALLLALAIMASVTTLPVPAAGLSPEYQINDRGQTHAFVIATDELQVAGARQPEKILPDVLATLPDQAKALSRARGKEVSLVLYPKGGRSEFSRRVLTRDVLVQLQPGADAKALAEAHGAKLARSFDHLPGYYLFTAPEPEGALTLAEALRGVPGVISAEPQLAKLAQKKTLPNDPLFSSQWHLRNTGQNGGTVGIDVNVTNVWNTFRGTNIYIAIVDDGVQYTHPDIAPNYNSTIDYDFNFHDLDPSPDPANQDFHGTSVAGLAAARGNNTLGISGVAYEAKLVALRLISYPETDTDDHDAMLHSNSVIHIKSNSWGEPDCDPMLGTVLAGPGPLMKAALVQGVTTGRNGKGEIYVWAGGNGLQCHEDVNYDGFANSINAFAIGALNYRGAQTYYSEPGACLVGCTPGGDLSEWITSTDLVGNDGYNYVGASGELADVNYTKTFGGTSAAAPIASGVIALILQANPNLGYRDVKEILLRSSTKVQPADADWKTNPAGISHNHKFGAGLLNAQAAVNLATNWVYLGPVTNVSLLQTNLNITIPDNTPAGVTRTFSFTNDNFRVEHITLTMTAPHPYWGDLAVTLTSPSGLQSRLAELHGPVDYIDYSYSAWVFSSVRHWGEKANGTWTVTVADEALNDIGTLNALELKLYGTKPLATLSLAKTNESIRLTLQAAAPGWTYAIDTSSNSATWSQLTTLAIPPSGRTSYTDTNALLQSRRFYRARLLP